MGKLVEALLERASSLGVELRVNAEVISVETSSEGVMLRLNSGDELRAKMLLFGAAPQVLEHLTGIKAPSFRDGSQVKMNMVLRRLPNLKSGVDPRKAFAGTFHIDESYEQLEKAYHQAKSGVVPDVFPQKCTATPLPTLRFSVSQCKLQETTPLRYLRFIPQPHYSIKIMIESKLR